MKKRTWMVLMLGVTLAVTGCGSKTKETEAVTEKATTEAETEEATTEAATEEETTETATEETTTEAETEEETTEAATEEETTETATEEETTEAVTEEATTEAETEEETTEAATEEETTEAVSEKETTKAVNDAEAIEAETEEETTEAATEEETAETETEEETTEAVTEEATTEAETEEATTEAETEEETTEAVTEEVTTEAVTEEATTEAETEEETTEVVTEEATTEASSEEATEVVSEEATTEAVSEEATTEATSEEETTEAESETETETEFVAPSPEDMPEYTALDYVTLGEYKGLSVTQEPIVISEDEINEVIAVETVETLEEGTVEEGDTVNIDYTGTIDGEEFDGGSAEGQSLEIGSGTFIEGFEDGLIGVEVGQEVDLNLTFPENYHSEDVAGKDVVFHVKVNSIDRVPELTDEVAARVADGKTAEEYKESVREQLAEEDEEEQKTSAMADLIQQVYANSKIDGYPTEYLEYNLARTKANYIQMAEAYGTTLDELLEMQGMTEDDFMAQMEDYLKQILGEEMVLKAVAEQEKMEISEDEYAEGLEKYATSAGVTGEELEEQYGENYIRASLLLDKAMRFLLDNATIVEEEATEVASEADTEALSEEVTEDVSETVSEADTEASSDEATEAVSEEETEEVSETASEEETEAASESETETESEETTEA